MSFNRAMALETEHLELDGPRVLEGVKALLKDAAKGFYLVAETEGRAVGQLMITYEWSDWRNATFWWIQSVYVEPSCRSSGVFTTLYRRVEAMAREAGACGLRLYVERSNARAQRSYERMGMHRASSYIFETDWIIRR